MTDGDCDNDGGYFQGGTEGDGPGGGGQTGFINNLNSYHGKKAQLGVQILRKSL